MHHINYMYSTYFRFKHGFYRTFCYFFAHVVTTSKLMLFSIVCDKFIETFGLNVCLDRFYRNRSAKHYRHRSSPDTNTVASLGSSGSESRNGLNRYYRQAWDNLHQSAVSPKHTRQHHHHKRAVEDGRRKETSPRVENMRDGAELVVNDMYHPYPQDMKRYHNHRSRPANRY